MEISLPDLHPSSSFGVVSERDEQEDFINLQNWQQFNQYSIWMIQ